MQESSYYSQNLNTIQTLQTELDELMSRHEKYWRQRSRAIRLEAGDHNMIESVKHTSSSSNI